MKTPALRQFMSLAVLIGLAACAASPTSMATATPATTGTTTAPAATATTPSTLHFTYRVVQRYPHDTGAFTEGLVYANGDLYESTGLQGQSSVRRVALATGQVIQERPLASQYFGEGLTIYHGSLIQLTWQSHVGFVYALGDLSPQGQFNYPTQGWGLTQDGRRLIMSDGSSTLYFLDPQTFARVGQVDVSADGNPVAQLNELEYVQGEVYANVWKTDQIARINPASGQVDAWIDLSGLLGPAEKPANPEDVLNGIAYDAAGDRLFVTGKGWPYLFQIALVPS